MKNYRNFLVEKIEYELKQVMLIIEEKIKKEGSYSFNFDINNFPSHLNITIIKENIYKSPEYHGEFDVIDAIKQQVENVNVTITIKDNEIDLDKLYSIIHHEIKHIYDLFNSDPDDFLNSDFYKKYKFYQFKTEISLFKDEFSYLFYLSLKHECDSRINQLYEYLKLKKIKDYDKLFDIFINMELYNMLIKLNNFNSKKFISLFDKNILLEITNQMNISLDMPEININTLELYYDQWEDFFKKTYIEYYNKSLETINEVIEDKITENKILSDIQMINNMIINDGIKYCDIYYITNEITRKFLEKLKN